MVYTTDKVHKNRDEVFYKNLTEEDKERVREYVRNKFGSVDMKTVTAVFIESTWISLEKGTFWKRAQSVHLAGPIYEVLQELNLGRQYILTHFREGFYLYFVCRS
jgi:hypothetical protein